MKLLQGREFRTWRMTMTEYLDQIDKTKDDALVKELNTLAMRSRISRLDKLYGDTLKELHKMGGKVNKSMENHLANAYKDNYYKNSYDIGQKASLNASFAEVDSAKIKKVLNNPWSGKNYSQRIWKNTDKLSKLIKNEVVNGIHRGVSVNKMAKLIQQRMDVGKYEATRLVRTEMNYVQNQAAKDSIKSSGMKYYIFLATLDRRTSSICRAHDRKVYPIDEAQAGTNMPPLHPNCRSTIAGSVKEFDIGRGKRVGRDGEGNRIYVPAAIKYDDFYKIYVEKSQTLAQWEKAQNIDYMSTSFHPKFGKTENVKVSGLKNDIAIRKIENSKFNLWTDMYETKRSMPIKICEKVLQKIQPTLPKILQMTQFVVLDFERHNINAEAIGGHDPNTGIIYINAKYRSEKAIVEYLTKTKGFFASTDITAPYLHELGHKYYKTVIGLIAKKKNISYNQAKEVIEVPIRQYVNNNSRLKYDLVKKEIGTYAYLTFDKKPDETFAEVFSLWGINLINDDSTLAGYIKNYFEKLVNDNEVTKS